MEPLCRIQKRQKEHPVKLRVQVFDHNVIYTRMHTFSTCWASFSLNVSFVTELTETCFSRSALSSLQRLFFEACAFVVCFRRSYIAAVALGIYLHPAEKWHWIWLMKLKLLLWTLNDPAYLLKFRFLSCCSRAWILFTIFDLSWLQHCWMAVWNIDSISILKNCSIIY